jgi:hypothetical protein
MSFLYLGVKQWEYASEQVMLEYPYAKVPCVSRAYLLDVAERLNTTS